MSIVRTMTKAVGILLVSLLLHLVLYGTVFTLENASNAIFVIAIIVFLLSLILQSGAFQVFQGFGYSTKALWNREFRMTYPNYSDYKAEKAELAKEKPIGYLEMLVASGGMLLVAIVLGRLA